MPSISGKSVVTRNLLPHLSNSVIIIKYDTKEVSYIVAISDTSRYKINIMNILLLNPPGKKLYVRDYYCSKVSKARYSYEPLDLLMLSGILSTHHRISVLDAIVHHTSPSDCLKEIKAINPQVVISLTGAVSYYEDVEFWKSLKFIKCAENYVIRTL